MAISGDQLKFMAVALTAMVAFRVVNDYSSGTSTPGVVEADLVHRRHHDLKSNEVLIEYCTGCQYKGTYNQVSKIIQARALEKVEVRGAEYPVSADRKQMAQVVFYLQLGVFALIFFGGNLLTAMKMTVPGFLNSVMEHKFAAFMLVWLIGNQIQGSLLSTKAFEMYHGDKLIWSSLEEKRLPQMEDVVKAFANTDIKFMTL